MWGPLTSSFPEWDRPSQGLQLHRKTPWLFTSLRPHFIVYIVTTALLASFYLILGVLWYTTHVFDTLHDIKRLGRAHQLVLILNMAMTTGIISLIVFAVQAIAADMAIRRRSSKTFRIYASVLTDRV